jgi:hypothetical protein
MLQCQTYIKQNGFSEKEKNVRKMVKKDLS